MKFFAKILLVGLLALSAQAVGAKLHRYVLGWTPTPSPAATGYGLYWRSGTNAYSDTNRFGIAIGNTTFDLRTLNLPPALYSLAMSATNDTAESDLSVEVQWDARIPFPPSNLKIQ